MSTTDTANKATASEKSAEKTSARTQAEPVLQVERRDFVDLVPENRARVQPMRGFDPCYTDIVDYIVRCTHKIWDERDVGLIYSHYTHNCVLYNALGTIYTREQVVLDTLQRLVAFPERRGMATQVIWNGNDVDGFYTSHLVTGSGRHTQPSQYGKPTNRTFTTRTVADCMILENKIYREWVVSDNMSLMRQLGLDTDQIAYNMAKEQFDKGFRLTDIGENRRLLGQYPPESDPDYTLAHSDTEAQVLGWLHEIYNKRMLGKVKEVYASNVQWHGPLMKELYGQASVIHQTLALIGMIPDGAWMPQHICSNPCEEGGTKVAVRWVMEGHHLGYGELGKPTGQRLLVMGMSHYHVVNGKIVDEWVVYDHLAMLAQIKLGQLAETEA
ncbi:ester cyclase [Pantoea sp. PNT02]|uniref:nuclear transport factor 2 family protein n=1 Tax=Pantoea sp. PNT02 TaxID=2769261 RepID=UPI00177AF81F|nr:ester cyclase [Pantoea sp. PNT02]MBD9646496.1 ester cyclase [Pantoea sp. PNT02]